MAIQVMDASALDAAIREAMTTMVCEIAKAAFLDVVYMGDNFATVGGFDRSGWRIKTGFLLNSP